jgi:glycosyltransferase involved in cell wall biosynthesis
MKTPSPENHPRITIVTPSLNQGRYIRETIESIITQDYPNLEYFIIDGGSTDGSVDIIREYEDQVDYWVSENDRGQSDAIMKGSARATGELFAWVNSDDVLLPGCLTAIAENYLQNQKPDIVTANVTYMDDDGKITRYVRLPQQSRFFFFRGIWHASAPAVFFKTSLFHAAGGVNPDYHLCMDLDLWMKMMKKGARVAHISQYLGAFRWHANAKTVISIDKQTAALSSERTVILKENITGFSIRKVLFWRKVYKLYQIANLNYLREYLSCRSVKGKLWWQIFRAGPSALLSCKNPNSR